MDAIASSKMRKQTACPSSKRAAAAYGFFGLLIAWLTVLSFAEAANLPIETFEAAANFAALSALAISGALFWAFGKARNGGDAGCRRRADRQADS